MALKFRFNPLTGNLDLVDIASAASTPAAGSNQQIPFNDGGVYGASAGLTFDKSTQSLAVAGNDSVAGNSSIGGSLSVLGNLLLSAFQVVAGTITALIDTNINFVTSGTGKLLYNGIEVARVGGGPDFTSADQVVSSAGTFSIAHGLGAAPTQVWCALVCQTAELNYSVGDVVQVWDLITNAGSDRGVSIFCDATNINAILGSGASSLVLLNKTTGAGAPITNANWKLRFYANR